jgi:collagenase-like PrtC family protease
MKFAVGYQLPEEDEEPITKVVADYRDLIEEVYFPWLDMPSGRSPMASSSGYTEETAQERLMDDLRVFRGMGIKLDVLFNANCYGGASLSQSLADQVCSIVGRLVESVGLEVVTTTSLMIARTIRRRFPQVDVRASVNMRLGTVKAMEYVADFFDSFYLHREFNRDFGRIREIKEWTDANGKGLHLLVNSGCMSYCSGQTFHDNLVAHEAEIAETLNVSGWNPSLCWNYYADRSHWVSLLQNSWIRPEDLHHYEGWFSVGKLATRMHSNPRKVLHAYCERRYRGNLLDLFEPGHGPLIAPFILDNSRFPEDWFERTTECGKRCHQCRYCTEVLGQVLVSTSGMTGS